MGWKDDLVILEENLVVDGNNGGQDEPVACECAVKGKCCDDETCFNFSTQIECVECANPACKNQRLQRKQWAKLEVRETPLKHGYGLFAGEDLQEGQFVLQFLGEVINTKTMHARSNNGAKQLYLQNIGPNCYFDATKKGSIARFTNHCCEPNVKHERWIVDGRLCIGVFALKDVKKGEELGFDYHWKYNRQKPTRCHCGADTCRGFLEELDEETKQFYTLRKGVWRSSAEAVQECAQATASEGVALHQWLVDKRVRIFWEGNHKRWDANVETWDAEKKAHVVFYIVDNKASNESLLLPEDPSQCNPKVEWQWLDESQQEHTISKKKEKQQEGGTNSPSGVRGGDDMFGADSDDDGVVVVADAGAGAGAGVGYNRSAPAKDSAGSFGGRVWADKPPERPPQKQKLRITVTVSFLTAQFMVVTTLKSASAPVSSAFTAEDAHDKEAVYARFLELIRIHCPAVRCQRLPSTASGMAARTAGGAAGGSMQVLVFGDEDHVKTVQELLVKNATQQQGLEADRSASLQQELSSRQGQSLGYDWRVLASLVEIKARSVAFPNDELLQTECALLSSVHAALEVDSGVFNQLLMCPLDKVPDTHGVHPTSAVGAGSTSTAGTDNAAFNSQMLSEVSKQTLLGSMRKLGDRLNCYAMTTLHATALLLRYLNYSGATDGITRESTPLIAACIMLAEKARGNFSPTHLRRFVTAAYCVVFNREETSAGDMTTVVQRTLISEGKVLQVLRSDVGIPDVVPLVYRNWCMAENNVPVDDLWMFDKHSGGLKGCGALGVSLATTFPTFWQMWAPDVMSISSLMVDCIACELTEQKVYGNGGMALTPQPIFCAMWQVASASLRLSLNQMLWLLQRTAGLAACLSADLQPRWFHDMQEDSEKRNPTLSRLDWKKLVGCVGELAEMWLRQGQLLDFTFDEGAQGNISAQRAFGDSYCLRFPWLGAGAGLDAATHLDASKSLDGSNSISGGGGITALSREMYSAVLPAQQALHMSAGHLGYGDKPAVASLRPWPVDRAARKEAGQLKAAHLVDGDGGGGSDLGCGVSASAVHELCMLQQLHYYSALHTLCSGNSNDAALVGETRMQPVCPYVMPVLGIATLPGTFGMPKFSRTESVLGSKNNSEESAASLEVSSVSSPREENEISATSLRYSNEEAGEEVDFLRAITLGSNADSPRGGGGSGGKTASQCFLVAPPVHLSLETLLNYNAKRSSQQPLSPAFALELCRDVFSAVDHLTSAGLVLKWLDPAHIFVSSNGRIMLGGLQGATHAGSGALSCGLPSHITLLEREREKTEREIRKKRHEDRRRHKKRSRGDDADGSSRKRHKSSSSERGNSSGSGGIGAFKLVKGSKVNKPSLPHLPSAAPEIILGGLASVRSSMYSAAAVCVGIFSGKLLFRGADSEQAHLQQIYKTLGTPSKEAPAAAANYFKELPLESLYGGHVVTPDGPQSTRSRAFKSLRATIPSNALAQFSVEDLAAAVRPEAHGQDKLLDEHYSDNGGLLDVLRGCLCLAPHRRFESAAQVLQQRLFASNKPVSSAQRVLELERRRDSRT